MNKSVDFDPNIIIEKTRLITTKEVHKINC